MGKIDMFVELLFLELIHYFFSIFRRVFGACLFFREIIQLFIIFLQVIHLALGFVHLKIGFADSIGDIQLKAHDFQFIFFRFYPLVHRNLKIRHHFLFEFVYCCDKTSHQHL